MAFQFFLNECFSLVFIKAANNIYLKYRNHVGKYIFVTTNNPQEFKHLFCRFDRLNSLLT